MENFSNRIQCPRHDLSAYLDGELTAVELERLEIHLADCDVCRRDLNLQKGLVRALESDDFAWRNFSIPEGFSRTVAVNAESRVAGLRRRSERQIFLLILAALLAVLLLTVGGDFVCAFGPAAVAADAVFATLSALGHLLFNIGFGAVVILRTLTRQADIVSLFLLAALTILLAFLLSRLHRYLRSSRSEG